MICGVPGFKNCFCAGLTILPGQKCCSNDWYPSLPFMSTVCEEDKEYCVAGASVPVCVKKNSDQVCCKNQVGDQFGTVVCPNIGLGSCCTGTSPSGRPTCANPKTSTCCKTTALFFAFFHSENSTKKLEITPMRKIIWFGFLQEMVSIVLLEQSAVVEGGYPNM
jgi:hypothetical protein